MGGSLPVGSEAQPSVDVEADVRTEVVLDPSTREILAVRVHAEATAEVGADLHGVFSPLGLPDDLFAGLAGGHTVTADVVFDLTDPYVLSNIDQIVKGDLGGLPNLYDNSAATVGIATITTNDVVGFGVVVADYSVNVINSETILRVDKIPGHGWERTG